MVTHTGMNFNSARRLSDQLILNPQESVQINIINVINQKVELCITW